MTHRTTSDPTPVADALLEDLQQVKNAPLFQRGDAAVRLAASTIVALRQLERRVTALEDQRNGT